MTLYKLSNLTKRYGSRCVVDIPRLELEEGKIYALLGPNGAGKTTLMNMLAFLDTPSSGRLSFKDRLVRFSESELQPLRRQVIMVDQNPILFSTSVYKNIEFGLKVRRIDKAQRTRLVEESLEMVGMRSFAAADAHKLSGGETQRVALARALALSPQVFLCDEPTANVDVENQAIIIDLLQRINANKKITVIFTTHDRSQATMMTQDTLLLDDGGLIDTGYDNFFSATVTRDFGATPRLSVGLQLELPLPEPQDLPQGISAVKISIDPTAIRIVSTSRSDVKSKAEYFKIVSVAQENGGVRLVVVADVELTVKLRPEIYGQLKPMVGERVKLEIPPAAVKLI